MRDAQSKTAEKYGKRVERKTRDLQWVRLGSMKVSPMAQRELNSAWVQELVAEMDPEQLGNPEVNQRGHHYYIMDGQHRIEAVKQWLGDDWQEQHVECWVTRGLTEQEEAETFLMLNRKLNINTFDKFRVSVKAGRAVETDIKAIVESQGLCIAKSRKSNDGAISAVGTLRKVYQRDGSESLGRALAIIRDAYGDAGFDSPVIDGVGLLCGRYNGALKDHAAVGALKTALGGVSGLLNAAEQLRQKTGNAKNHCVAAAAVTVINRKLRGGAKLPGWWQ